MISKWQTNELSRIPLFHHLLDLEQQPSTAESHVNFSHLSPEKHLYICIFFQKISNGLLFSCSILLLTVENIHNGHHGTFYKRAHKKPGVVFKHINTHTSLSCRVMCFFSTNQFWEKCFQISKQLQTFRKSPVLFSITGYFLLECYTNFISQFDILSQTKESGQSLEFVMCTSNKWN